MRTTTNKIRTAIICTLATISLSASAQTLQSSYFLESMVMRHKLNPALRSPKGYFSIPVLGNINVSMNSNVGLKSFIYPANNNTSLTTFMDPSVSAGKFLKGINKVNTAQVDFDMAILSTGFHAWEGFNTIDISLRGQSVVDIPGDLFKMMKLGMNDPTSNRYRINNLNATTTEFVEFALGHSHDINDRLTVGAKIKILAGLADIRAQIHTMDITLSQDVWQVNANGNLRAGVKGASFTTDRNGEITGIEYENPGVAGWGGAVDLGATYKMLDNLILSAALTDIGFISWSNALHGKTKNEPYTFEGFRDIAFDDSQSSNSIDNQLESLTDDLADLARFYDNGNLAYTKSLRSTLRVGAEYGVLNNKISFGLLSSTRFGGTRVHTQLMGSANFRPAKWFHAAITGTVSTYGCAYGWLINFCPGGMNLFLGSDYMIGRITPQGVPIGKANLNVNFGLSVPMGKAKAI